MKRSSWGIRIILKTSLLPNSRISCGVIRRWVEKKVKIL